MKSIRAQAASVAFAVCLAVLGGCSGEPTTVDVNDAPPEVDAHAGHDHGELGPHGGHFLHVEPGGGHAEWVHIDEENRIEVYIGDEISDVTAVSMTIEVEGQEPQQIELTADESLGPAAYSVESPVLLNAIKMGEAAHVELEIEADGTTYTAAIEHHDHDH